MNIFKFILILFEDILHEETHFHKSFHFFLNYNTIYYKIFLCILFKTCNTNLKNVPNSFFVEKIKMLLFFNRK